MFALPDGRPQDGWCDSEIARLAPDLAASFIATDQLVPAAGDLFFAGERLPTAEIVMLAMREAPASLPDARSGEMLDAVSRFQSGLGLAGLRQHLRQSGHQIVRDTAKASDGIVSRHLNRPISRRISTMLLRMRSIQPIYATAAAALTAVLMFVCLASGTHAGMIAGAILFQVASVIDGVDGEIARATFRQTARGATLDSLTDAATNLAFLFGLGLSLRQQGADNALMLGIAGFVAMAIGLVLLGGHARMSGRPVNFDALKHVVRRKRSSFGDWLIWLTMRDFLALASAAMVVLGFGYGLLTLFALGALLWCLAATGFVLHDSLRAGRKKSQ
jgi:CDP-L-myo-inositol myo-inositolphosphotransferase